VSKQIDSEYNISHDSEQLNQITCVKRPLSVHPSIPNLVLVVGVAVTEVSYQPDEVCLEADDRRLGGGVCLWIEGEVLSCTENVLTGLPDNVHLPQELCKENVKSKKQESTRV